jgi:hypothetical protein
MPLVPKAEPGAFKLTNEKMMDYGVEDEPQCAAGPALLAQHGALRGEDFLEA